MEFGSIDKLIIIAAYLVGSIPFGILITKFAGLGDVRNIGSGNIGATNVLRTGNKSLALMTLFLDGGKGAIAVLIAAHYANIELAMLAGAAAFLGHCFPVYLRFKGGKGVATFFGTLLAINWMVGVFCLLIWLAVASILRISSLAGIISAIAAPVLSYFLAPIMTLWVTLFMTVVILFRHKDNISRLLKGTEPRIGDAQI